MSGVGPLTGIVVVLVGFAAAGCGGGGDDDDDPAVVTTTAGPNAVSTTADEPTSTPGETTIFVPQTSTTTEPEPSP